MSVAFVDAKPPKPDDFFLPDIPFSNLLTSTVDVPAKGEREAAAAPQSQVNTLVLSLTWCYSSESAFSDVIFFLVV